MARNGIDFEKERARYARDPSQRKCRAGSKERYRVAKGPEVRLLRRGMTLTLNWIMTTPTRQPRRFGLTPDRLILGLLAVEGLLWLSNRPWLARLAKGLCGPGHGGDGRRGPSGYVPLVRSRLGLPLTISIQLAVAADIVRRCRLSERLDSGGGETCQAAVGYGGEGFGAWGIGGRTTGGGISMCWKEERGWPERFFGDELLHDINMVGFRTVALDDQRLARLCETDGMETVLYLWLEGTKVTDKGLGALRRLARLRTLGLRGTAITDEGLEHVKALRTLQFLDLSNTKVSDAGVQGLQEALPACRIRRWE